MFWAILGEMPSIFVSFYLIDNENFGRKGCLAIFSFILMIVNIFSYFEILFGFSLFINRLCIRLTLSVLYVN
jgi:hypothetical protein